MDEVSILSPEEELTEDEDDDESGFVFWEEFFLIVVVVPSSAVHPDCVAAVPVPFKVGPFVPPPAPPDSPRWLSQLFVGLISPPSPPPPADTTELFFDTSTPSFDDSAPDVDPFADFLEELTETDLGLLPCDVLVFPLTDALPVWRESLVRFRLLVVQKIYKLDCEMRNALLPLLLLTISWRLHSLTYWGSNFYFSDTTLPPTHMHNTIQPNTTHTHASHPTTHHTPTYPHISQLKVTCCILRGRPFHAPLVLIALTRILP